MRKTVLAMLVAVLAATFVNAAVASHVATTGTQLSLYRGNCVYAGNLDRPIMPEVIERAANSPFFVRHGWVIPWSGLTNEEKQAAVSDNTRFDLYLDGVLQNYTPDQQVENFDGELSLIKLFLTNYGDGMTGTHVFRGDWWIDGLLIEEDPGEAYLELRCVLQVDFV